ncbi:serine/threonine-protein kinase [Streptomyces sp. NPDC047079]|uniref:serine/threonine-protein kinase n=1 Tax=Streptomyces sp. NPDC047079 TaxID=3154607 RepID=UPI0033E69C5B
MLQELGEKDPRTCGGFRLLGRLGAGGMGVVYLGEDDTGRQAAVKIMRSEYADDAVFRERFHREARALAAVSSPHVVEVVHLPTAGEMPYLVTEYVSGGSLAERLEAGPLPVEDVARLAEALAWALETIHAAGIVHRDLKPSNVLLGADGPKVIDFGIAQLADATAVTRTGWRLGTPGYLAPEQLATGTAGPAADVYTWGLVVASAALGRHPFGTGPAEALAYRIQHTTPDLSGLPPHLVRAVSAALRSDPHQRPLSRDLPRLLREPATLTASYTYPGTALSAGRGMRWWHKAAIAAAVSGVLSAALAAYALSHQSPAAGHALTPSAPSVRHGAGSTAQAQAAASTAPTSPSKKPHAATSSLTESAPTPSLRPVTQVSTYTPWTFGEPADDVRVVASADGNCFASSQAAFRPDAYRCIVGSELKDPCFSPPNDPSPAVLCPTSGAIGKVFKINLTEALPDTSGMDEQQPFPFKIVLADGQVCDSYQGSGIAIAGKTMSFACPHGDLFGGPDTTSSTWTIDYRPTGASSFHSTDIAAVYQ